MKIVSWNIAGAHTFTKEIGDALSYEKEDLDYFINQLKEQLADFVLLQEAHTSEDGKESQANIIAKELGFGYFENHPYCSSHIKKGQRLTLSNQGRLPIRKGYFYKLPNPNLEVIRPDGQYWRTFDAGFLVTEVDNNGSIINVVNGHMIPFHYYNSNFADPKHEPIRDSITKFFLELSSKPTVIAADFNYENLRTLLPKIFVNNLYNEAFEGRETARGKGQQDHILFSKHFKLQNYEVLKFNADHYICTATLELL